MASSLLPIATRAAPYAAMRHTLNDFMKEFIDDETKPEVFENECKKHDILPKDEFGQYCLKVAARRGNVPLVTHIVTNAGKELLDQGDRFGETPLHKAARAANYGMVKTLIQLGANVNITTHNAVACKKCGCDVIRREGTKKLCASKDKGELGRATALWYAAKSTNNTALLKLMLKHDAVVELALPNIARDNLEPAQREFKAENEALFKEIDESLTCMPKDLTKLIAEYTGHYLVDGQEDLQNEEWHKATVLQ